MKYKVRVNSSIESESVETFLKNNGFNKPYGNFILINGWVCIDENKNILCVAMSQAGKEIDDYKTISFDQLKGMTKPEEYLFKGIDGTYKVVDHDCQGRAIEIPDGADAYVDVKGAYKGFICNTKLSKEHIDNALWFRHTQPEELPFVDDECLLDQVSKYVDDDQVNNPQHYTSGSIECIDAIESSMSEEAFAGFLKGNVQKYMWRYENKGGVESLQKAQWYLNRLILLQSAHD